MCIDSDMHGFWAITVFVAFTVTGSEDHKAVTCNTIS